MTTLTSEASPTQSELDRLAERADRLLAEIRLLPDEAQTKALDLKNAIEAFHRLGLTRIVQTLKQDPRGKELLFELADDPAVHTLLIMHGLIRSDPFAQVERVLDTVRPYLKSHGGDVILVDVEDSKVRVRLSGSCNGCSLSSVTMRNTVEEALKEQLPHITSVEVVPEEPTPAAGFVSLDSIAMPLHLEPGWEAGPMQSDVPESAPYRWDTGKTSVLIVRFHGQLHAYRNECAHLGMTLDGGPLDEATGILTCPWHGFRYDVSNGECITVPEAQLEALPLRIEAGRILVRTAA